MGPVFSSSTWAVKWTVQNFSPWFSEINAGGAMSKRPSHFNPYTVLGIQPDASTAEIKKAHRQKLIEAQYSASISVKHVEAAYLVLVDPDQRQRLDKKLNDAAFDKEFSSADTDFKVKSEPHPKQRTRQRRMALLAGVLLAVLAFSFYFFVLRGGEICPLCHHKSVVETGRTGSRVTVSCTRASCSFSYVYDQAVDLANDPDED